MTHLWMIFPLIKTSIYRGFSMAMLNNQMVNGFIQAHFHLTSITRDFASEKTLARTAVKLLGFHWGRKGAMSQDVQGHRWVADGCQVSWSPRFWYFWSPHCHSHHPQIVISWVLSGWFMRLWTPQIIPKVCPAAFLGLRKQDFFWWLMMGMWQIGCLTNHFRHGFVIWATAKI